MDKKRSLSLGRDTISTFNLISAGVIFSVAIFQIFRFSIFPQFIDEYYHLHTALGFLKAGGWASWSFWDYAPVGRPNIYPPLYHILISGLLQLNFSGVVAIRILNTVIPIAFFFVLWLSLKELFNEYFSCMGLLIVFGTFTLFFSFSTYLPATLALLWGFLGMYFFKKRKPITSVIFLVFCIYTHSGVSIGFILSLILFLFFYRCKKYALGIILSAVGLGLPLFFYQLLHIDSFKVVPLRQEWFTSYAVFVILFCFIGFFVCLKKKGFYLWLICLLFGLSLVFGRYWYRFFSCQGLLVMGLIAASVFEEFTVINDKKKVLLSYFIVAVLFLGFNSYLKKDGQKFKFNLFGSTIAQIANGELADSVEFNSLLYPNLFDPVRKVIVDNSTTKDIISSNMSFVSVILGSLTNRAITTSVLVETGKNDKNIYKDSKLVVWMRTFTEEEAILHKNIEKVFGWQKIFENKLMVVFKRPYFSQIKPVKASLGFVYIYFLLAIAFLFIVFELYFIKGKKTESYNERIN